MLSEEQLYHIITLLENTKGFNKKRIQRVVDILCLFVEWGEDEELSPPGGEDKDFELI